MNPTVGGLNPSAVDAAIRYGGKEIWMPSFYTKAHMENFPAFKGVARGPSQGIVLVENGALLPEVYDILDAYKLPTAEWRVAADAEEAAKAAAEIGFPVVVKADSAAIVHKSDEGGVAVNLGDEAAVMDVVNQMSQRFDADDLSFFVQKFMPGGLELIMGAKAVEGLGHAVMFGLGGIFVEIMKDVVFELTPVASGEAEEMLTSIQAAALLDGARGQDGIDKGKAVEIIQQLSQLLTDLPDIQEMDLNPLMAFADGVYAVDARIAL